MTTERWQVYVPHEVLAETIKAGLSLNGNALTTEQAVKAIEFVLSCDDEVLIPEIGIKHI